MKGQVVLVTGGAQGLGRGIAEAFIKRGARVVLADIQDVRGAQVAEDLGPQARFLRADVSSEESVRELHDSVVRKFGGLDCAVNNAGVLGPLKPLWEWEEREFDQVVGVNLDGCFFCMKHQIPLLRERGGGSIINVSSVNGLRGMANCAVYSATKAGILGLTRTAARECSVDGVRINAVCPGPFQTEFLQNEPEEVVEATPLGRLGTPCELGDVVAWLASPQASFVQGQALRVDGGLLS